MKKKKKKKRRRRRRRRRRNNKRKEKEPNEGIKILLKTRMMGIYNPRGRVGIF